MLHLLSTLVPPSQFHMYFILTTFAVLENKCFLHISAIMFINAISVEDGKSTQGEKMQFMIKCINLWKKYLDLSLNIYCSGIFLVATFYKP